MGIPRSKRIVSGKDYSQVLKRGRRFYTEPFLFCFLERKDQSFCRLGVIASKKVGGAVQRNHSKRIVRALFRLYGNQISKPGDLVIIVRWQVHNFNFDALTKVVNSVCEKVRFENNSRF